MIEASPMELVCRMPSIHFKPVENKKKAGKGKRNDCDVTLPFSSIRMQASIRVRAITIRIDPAAAVRLTSSPST